MTQPASTIVPVADEQPAPQFGQTFEAPPVVAPGEPPKVEVPANETDRIEPPSETITLSSGTVVRIMDLKMRQLFRLLRIITRGGAAYLPMLREALAEAGDDDAGEIFGTQLMAIAVIALPEAENEAIDFLMSVCDIAEVRPGTDKATQKYNEEQRVKLQAELYNPEPEDAVSIIENVIQREKDDLVALGKRLGQAFKIAQKTGQIPDPNLAKTESTDQTPVSSEASLVPLTSSVPNTVGTTKPSSNSD